MRRKAAGQRPKPDDERQRRNIPAYDRVQVEWDGIIRGPTLPKLGGKRKWSSMSKKLWWEFRRSPQSMVCIESDWFFLLDTMLLYDRMWTDPDSIPSPHLASISAEVRRRFSYYGWTWDDRVKQKIDIVSPQADAAQEAAVEAEARSAVNYAEMLAAKAAEIQEQ